MENKMLYELDVYEVSFGTIDEWNEDEGLKDWTCGPNDLCVYCTDIADAIKIYADNISKVGENEVLQINYMQIGIEKPLEEDFVLDFIEYENQYGKCIQYGHAFVIQDYYNHEGISDYYANEALEYLVRDKAEYYNMRVICEKAGINYSTFRGFKNNKQPISDNKLIKLLETMSTIGRNVWNDELQASIDTINKY